MNFLRLCILLIAIALATILFGCRTAPVYNIYSSPVPMTSAKKATMDQVEQAIVGAAGELGWNTRLIASGHIEANIMVRAKHTAAVDIKYTSDSFSIKYKYSNNLKYDGIRIHKNYNSWIRRLKQRITSKLTEIIVTGSHT
jgi:hypothetical protein